MSEWGKASEVFAFLMFSVHDCAPCIFKLTYLHCTIRAKLTLIQNIIIKYQGTSTCRTTITQQEQPLSLMFNNK